MKRLATLLLGICLLAVPFSLPGGLAEEGPNDKHPRVVLIIRHAEKPPEEAKSVHLSAEGTKRALALPQLFQASPNRPDPFPTPAFIFAAKDSKHSHRPVETVTPLARTLKLPIHSHHENEDFAGLAREILGHHKYAGKTILICWHHGTIPLLARELKVSDAPDHWKGTVFDRVWQISYDGTGKAKFANRPQHLLPGDSEK